MGCLPRITGIALVGGRHFSPSLHNAVKPLEMLQGADMPPVDHKCRKVVFWQEEGNINLLQVHVSRSHGRKLVKVKDEID